MIHKPLAAIFSCLIVASYAIAAPQKPLSCEMQMLLNGIAAVGRDTGSSRQEFERIFTKDGELTKKEIKEIMDRVYITSKNKTPDQIKDAVYQKCSGKS